MEIAVVLGAALAWLLFVYWYGGAGKPMSASEKERILSALTERLQGGPHADFITQAKVLLDSDDGKEFVMHNSVRYRPVAVYPPGKDGPTDPRAADRLYFKAALPVLLRLASVPIFVARSQGEFITWPGTPRWHYVALVRYRSRRDFFKFALAIERSGHDVYKWAAIEATHFDASSSAGELFLGAHHPGLGLGFGRAGRLGLKPCQSTQHPTWPHSCAL
jgi:hypothetical protein